MRARFHLAAVLLVASISIFLGGATHADERSKVELAKNVGALVDADEQRLTEVFKQLHTSPELGFQEVKTAGLVASEFKKHGYETHTGIGKTGVVGILKNGTGPVVMFRSDM